MSTTPAGSLDDLYRAVLAALSGRLHKSESLDVAHGLDNQSSVYVYKWDSASWPWHISIRSGFRRWTIADGSQLAAVIREALA